MPVGRWDSCLLRPIKAMMYNLQESKIQPRDWVEAGIWFRIESVNYDSFGFPLLQVGMYCTVYIGMKQAFQSVSVESSKIHTDTYTLTHVPIHTWLVFPANQTTNIDVYSLWLTFHNLVIWGLRAQDQSCGNIITPGSFYFHLFSWLIASTSRTD